MKMRNNNFLRDSENNRHHIAVRFYLALIKRFLSLLLSARSLTNNEVNRWRKHVESKENRVASEVIERLFGVLDLAIDHRQLVSDIASRGVRSMLLRTQWAEQIANGQELRNSRKSRRVGFRGMFPDVFSVLWFPIAISRGKDKGFGKVLDETIAFLWIISRRYRDLSRR